MSQSNGLPQSTGQVRVNRMHQLARLLQVIGLAIPPLAMVSQLRSDISSGKMLSFLFVSVCVFLLGYGLQRYSGKPD